jgi:hypothetical protein
MLSRHVLGVVCVIGIGGLCLIPVRPAAAQNLLTNPSFEDGNFTGVNPQSATGATQLNVGATNITGWTTISAELAWIGTGNPYNIVAPDGVRSLDLTGYHDSAPYGGVSQSIATQPGATYNLTFLIGAFGGNTSQITATAGGTVQTLSFTGIPTNTANQWNSVGFNFVASGASTTISLVGASTTQGIYLGLDNASVTLVQAASTAPEPGSLALLGLTALPLVGSVVRCRRRA